MLRENGWLCWTERQRDGERKKEGVRERERKYIVSFKDDILWSKRSEMSISLINKNA